MKPKIKEEDRKKIHDELKDKFEYTFDMDNVRPVKHIWVDRGAVISCEGAGHPNHRVFKRLK
jgi:hypothetical protein